MITATLVIATLIAVALAQPQVRAMQVHEAREAAPPGFVLSGAAPSETTLDMRIALVQNNIAGLQKVLYDVSTPSSTKYGQYLTKEQVNEYVTPQPESVDAVRSWLAEYGVTASAISPAGDWLGFSVSVSKANEMLHTDFSVFTHVDSGETSIRTLSYSIPTALKGHVELVHPTTSFSSPTVNPQTFVSAPTVDMTSAVVPASCAAPIRPQCILDLYAVPNGTVAQNPSSMLAVTAYDGIPANLADLRIFLTDFRPDLSPNTTFTVQSLDGGSNPQNSTSTSLEGNLDTQYTVGVASGVPVVYIPVGTPARGHDAFLDTANLMLNETSPPYVMTTSYADAEPGISQSLAINLCNAYMQLGARGVSVLFASGDGGVGHGNCTTFVPTFPNDCPYVTAVGATTGVNPETAATLSSGGFSNYFARPSYQDTAVSTYLSALGSTYAGLYNASGRGFPDVSAQGTDIRMVKNGTQVLVKGTSASSPIFASIVALLNDALISAGRPPLGFLNPFLYSTGAAGMTDITAGNNPGCNTTGFPAQAGWDPVTGLGTPSYSKLKAVLGL